MTSISIDRTDGLSSAAAIKGPCKAATTVNITLYAEQTIDGVAIVTGDRVLVKNQSAAYENGIYVCDTGQWRRSKDFNRTNDVVKGTTVFVTDGAVSAETLWTGHIKQSGCRRHKLDRLLQRHHRAAGRKR
jgi:uncharacterized cupin superfamily protein